MVGVSLIPLDEHTRTVKQFFCERARNNGAQPSQLLFGCPHGLRSIPLCWDSDLSNDPVMQPDLSCFRELRHARTLLPCSQHPTPSQILCTHAAVRGVPADMSRQPHHGWIQKTTPKRYCVVFTTRCWRAWVLLSPPLPLSRPCSERLYLTSAAQSFTLFEAS